MPTPLIDRLMVTQRDETEEFLKQKAKDQGMSYHEFCKLHGIIGPSQRRRIRRHEALESDLDD